MSWPIPPLLLRAKRTGWPSLWLPLVVLWPLLALAWLLAVPLCFLNSARQDSRLAPLTQTYRLVCSLHLASLELSTSPGVTWAFSVY